jgi:hypothetical protein
MKTTQGEIMISPCSLLNTIDLFRLVRALLLLHPNYKSDHLVPIAKVTHKN